MTTTATGNLDMSPEAIAARRVARLFASQDRALELREGGMAPKDVGRTIGVATPTVHAMVGAAQQRRRAMVDSGEAVDVAAMGLKERDLSLLEALAREQMSLWEEHATRSPESKAVSWRVRRANGWAVAHARKRLATEVDPKEGQTPDRHTGRVPGLGLVALSGNGYVNMTPRGWAVVRAALPAILPW